MLTVFFFFFAATSCLAAFAVAFAPICAALLFSLLGYLSFCAYQARKRDGDKKEGA